MYKRQILNNIPADTAELVDREQVGLNVGEDTAARVAAMTVEPSTRPSCVPNRTQPTVFCLSLIHI